MDVQQRTKCHDEQASCQPAVRMPVHGTPGGPLDRTRCRHGHCTSHHSPSYITATSDSNLNLVHTTHSPHAVVLTEARAVWRTYSRCSGAAAGCLRMTTKDRALCK